MAIQSDHLRLFKDERNMMKKKKTTVNRRQECTYRKIANEWTLFEKRQTLEEETNI